MTVNAIPKGYHTITPYFSVREAHELVDFLKRAFDAEEMTRRSAARNPS